MSAPPLAKRLRRLWKAKRLRDRRAVLSLGALASAILFALMSRTAGVSFVFCFVAFLPWLLVQERVASLRDAALAGLFMSVAFVALVFPWFPEAAAGYADTSSLLVWPLFLLLAPLLQPQFLVFALVRFAVRRGSPPEASLSAPLTAALAAAAAYVGVELVFPKLFFDTVGLGLHPSVYLRQAADLAGVHGLSLVVILVNEGLALSLLRLAARPRGARLWPSILPAALACSAVLALLGYGGARLSALARGGERPAINVGLVQANITNYDKLRAEKGAFETVRTILDTHFALSDRIRAQSAPDLLVWPETVYPTTFGAPKSEAGAAFDEEIGAYVAKAGVPLVFGAFESGTKEEYNAAFFLTPDANARVQTASYRKHMLFPLTEWVPEALDSVALRSALPWAGRWKRGPGAAVVRVSLSGRDDLLVVPLICYDVLFPGFVAEGAAKGADLLVTLSNDSWFPDGRAPRLHLVSAAFRSIETRVPQVRATNSGISAFISSDGEILAQTRFDAQETLSHRISRGSRVLTPMVAFGSLRAPLLLTLAALLLARALWLRAQQRGQLSANRGAARGRTLE
jgi:apolipoprotein N-acyltransferase